MSKTIVAIVVLTLSVITGCGSPYSLMMCNNTGHDIEFYLNGQKHSLPDKDYWIGDYISKTGKMYVKCNDQYWMYPVIYRWAAAYHRSLTLGRPIDLQIEPDGRIHQVIFHYYGYAFMPVRIKDRPDPYPTRFPLEPEIVTQTDIR